MKTRRLIGAFLLLLTAMVAFLAVFGTGIVLPPTCIGAFLVCGFGGLVMAVG
jgi:hypothetical protein